VPIFDARSVQRIRKPPPHSSIDESLVSRALEPFWSWLAQKTPLWLSPNAITLAGFVVVAIGFVPMTLLCPGFEGVAPRWVYAFAIVALFAFMTFDALDGKQARRTGTSSPLGGWLDHACDVITMQLAMTTVACSLGLGTGGLTLFLVASVLSNNIVIHWETKHTGTLFLGNGTSIYEATVTLMVVHAVTLGAGQGLWRTRVSSLVPAIGGLPLLDAPLNGWIVVVGVGAIGGLGVIGSLRRVHARTTGRGRAFLPTLVDLLPMFVLCVAVAIAHSFSREARVGLTFATSLLGLRLIGHVILQHLADLAPLRFDVALVPMVLTAAALVLASRGALPGAIDCAMLGWANLVFALVVSGRFFVGATFEIARALDVPILTLPPRSAGQRD
jgi:ethanolaminephosphotransferase